MTPEAHIEAIATHARALGAAADTAGLDAAVPTCPGWVVRDVVGHLGGVHRWAASVVAEQRTEPPGPGDELAAPPGDNAILEWFGSGAEQLVDVLRSADDSLECWSFLPTPFPRAFWARRQAHETAVHHADVEAATGGAPELDARFAVDGIDELLLGFFSRRGGKLLADPAVTLGVRAEDAGVDDAWTVRIGPQGREIDRGDARGDLVVSGPAGDLYLMLWNRRGNDGLMLTGHPSVLDLWRRAATVNW
jgi:uncharacterized protein (TIGR03083 family)